MEQFIEVLVTLVFGNADATTVQYVVVGFTILGACATLVILSANRAKQLGWVQDGETGHIVSLFSGILAVSLVVIRTLDPSVNTEILFTGFDGFVAGVFSLVTLALTLWVTVSEMAKRIYDMGRARGLFYTFPTETVANLADVNEPKG